MNRSPRRSLRIQPPLRGRAAATPGDQGPRAVIHQRPPSRSGHTTIVKVVEKPACEDLHPDWIALYKIAPALFKVLPWLWLGALAALISVSLLFGRLL
ncbi:MAG: hypothetical protein AAF921_17510 [Cyanobacteria bacterium P01_D01_bin.44]